MKSEVASRIAGLQKALQQADLHGALISHVANLYYLTGTSQSSQLFVPATGEALLMTRRSVERAQRESLLPVHPSVSPRDLGRRLQEAGLPEGARLGLELESIPASHFLRFQSTLPGLDLVNVSTTLRQLRAVKSPFELEQIRQAGQITAAMFRAVAEGLSEGVREIDLMAAMEAVARRAGHSGYLRLHGYNQELHIGHLFAGPNSYLPGYFDGVTCGEGLTPAFPQGAGVRPVQRDEPVVLDIFGLYGGYIYDQTRTLVIGNLPPVLERAAGAAAEILHRIESFARPGVTAGEVYEEARLLSEREGLAENFMGYGRDQLPFLGHGVGLQVDELPVLAKGVKTPLESGMVLAVEPKFAFPGQGLVGVENTYLVTPEGLQSLGSLPDDDLYRI